MCVYIMVTVLLLALLFMFGSSCQGGQPLFFLTPARDDLIISFPRTSESKHESAASPSPCHCGNCAKITWLSCHAGHELFQRFQRRLYIYLWACDCVFPRSDPVPCAQPRGNPHSGSTKAKGPHDHRQEVRHAALPSILRATTVYQWRPPTVSLLTLTAPYMAPLFLAHVHDMKKELLHPQCCSCWKHSATWALLSSLPLYLHAPD